MLISEYLEQKYKNCRCLAMSRREAEILGIEYPLISGWVHYYGDREIHNDQFKELKQYLSSIKQNRWTRQALKCIEDYESSFYLIDYHDKALNRFLRNL